MTTILIALFLLVLLPQSAHAANLSDFYAPAASLPQPGSEGILATFINPLIANVPVVTGISSFFVMLLAGFRYVVSSGNAQETEKASTMLTYSLVGLGLSILAFWLTRILFQVGGATDIF